MIEFNFGTIEFAKNGNNKNSKPIERPYPQQTTMGDQTWLKKESMNRTEKSNKKTTPKGK